MKSLAVAIAAAAAISLSLGLAGLAEDTGGGPVVSASPPAERLDERARLIFPADYRRWVFLTTGVNMSYAATAVDAEHPVFDNVFVDPVAYEFFLKNKTWPEGTVMVLEARGGASKGSINKAGNFQSGEPVAWEVHVKDSAHFPGGWAFFHFDHPTAAAFVIGPNAACYSCHQAHAAVDDTFVQFYPTLLPLATQAGTLSANYLKDVADQH